MPNNNSGWERDRLAELYAAMADEELRLRVHDFGSLSCERQEALEAEFRRRDLTQKLICTCQPRARVSWSGYDLVTIRQFRDLSEVLLAKGSLESAGIEAFLVDDNMVPTDWCISNLVGGIRLCLRQQDEEAALDALQQPTPAAIEVDGGQIWKTELDSSEPQEQTSG